jgi:CubicO group peptidase (beta-lactamase class C family)
VNFRRLKSIAPALLIAIWLVRLPAASGEGAADLEAAKARYQQIVEAELARGVVPGVSIAWVVDSKTVHATGYGMADAARGICATSDTIYRAGSISKLFNAIAAMQLVEQGKLDLDAPIEQALGEFRIVVPFHKAEPITPRQLLCHRSGMIRESPVGGYLDNSQPTVAATVASVANCVLVNPPNTKSRYSNVGPTIVGRTVEVRSGQVYAEYQERHILGPLGMSSSAWRMNDKLRPRWAVGVMRVARGDGTYAIEPAPQFELGTLPAGNLYTTATDLAKFAAFVMGSSSAADASPAILRRESLEKMLVPQLIDEPSGFGLGFFVGRHRDCKTVQHMGAVYGFTTSLVVLPSERVAVIVLSNADIATAAVRRLSTAGLDLLLETVRGKSPEEPEKTVELPAEKLGALAGRYESPGYWADLRGEGLSLGGEFSGQPIELAPVSDNKLLASGRIMDRAPFEFKRNDSGQVVGFTAIGQEFHRVDPAKTDRAPQAWRRYEGSYGLPFIPLVVSVRHGHLYALAENEYDYRLVPINRTTFLLPTGMYEDEHVVFQTDPEGKVRGVVMANMYLPRRGE